MLLIYPICIGWHIDDKFKFCLLLLLLSVSIAVFPCSLGFGDSIYLSSDNKAFSQFQFHTLTKSFNGAICETKLILFRSFIWSLVELFACLLACVRVSEWRQRSSIRNALFALCVRDVYVGERVRLYVCVLLFFQRFSRLVCCNCVCVIKRSIIVVVDVRMCVCVCVHAAFIYNIFFRYKEEI